MIDFEITAYTPKRSRNICRKNRKSGSSSQFTCLVRKIPKLKVLSWKPFVLIVTIRFDRQWGQMFASYLKLVHYRFFLHLFQLIIR